MKAYFIGSGIGALAGAAFLIRDGGVSGSDITIFEKQLPFGGPGHVEEPRLHQPVRRDPR
jgi:myosin-crossreactive antigen